MATFHLRYPGGLAKAATFSYDDGIKQDIRLAELLDKYGLKGSFNIYTAIFDRETPDRMTAEEIREHILRRGHEVAIHGHDHLASGAAHPIRSIKETLTSREILESTFGRIIRGMAYPDTGIRQFGNFGNYESVKKYLCELDIAYARSLGADNDSFELPSDFHNWIPTAHHDNPEIIKYIDKFLSIDVSKKAYHARRIPRLFYIWGHSYEFEMKNKFISHARNVFPRAFTLLPRVDQL